MSAEQAPTVPDIAKSADFSAVRYAQVWEDADVLLAGLDVQPGDVCLSIASAGDNALALLARSPAKVVALDLSAAQLACLEVRVAAYRALDHEGLLELIGSRPSKRRHELYEACRRHLSPEAELFWDTRPYVLAAGIGRAGKFERYFNTFRRRALPLVHGRDTVELLLVDRPREERIAFYHQQWDTWRWRLMFRIFFSRLVMGRLGRDPRFFDQVKGSVADRILVRAEYALTELNPAENPYMQWILLGWHTSALPFALRAENFAGIRANLDRLEWRRQSLEAYLEEVEPGSIDRFNLSDVYEYMPPAQAEHVMEMVARAGRPGGRAAYWNMLAARSRPERLADQLRPLTELSTRLHLEDKAFFYNAFHVDEILSGPATLPESGGDR